MSHNPNAARNFYKAVRQFSLHNKPWQGGSIIVTLNPDETWDLSKVSRRAYQRPDEYLAVMAACGLSSIDQPIIQKTITLPNDMTLKQIKRNTGFETIAELIEDGKPTWLQE